MASSYSTDLKLELMVTGENAGTWGDKTNTNLNLVQQAIAGVESITLTDGGTKALAMSDAALSDARNMVLKIATITLSSASNLTIPDGIEKFYILDATGVTNPTNLTFKTASGTGFTLDAAKIYAAYADGTNIVEVSLDSLGGTIGSAQIADNAVVTAKISNANVTTAKIADNAITTAKISANQVTSAEIADDAVGPDQLSNTAVSPGQFSSATITVDAQGRITAASSGSAGAGGFVLPAIYQSGSSATLNPATNFVAGTAKGGSGGGGGGTRDGGPSDGGEGAYGYFYGPASGTLDISPGAGGAGGAPSNGPSQSGQVGGTTTVGSAPVFISVSGGNGGQGGRPNPGGTRSGEPGNRTSTVTGNNFLNLNPTTFRSVLGGDDCGGQPTGTGSGPNQRPGVAGQAGSIVLFENFGV